MAVRPDAGLISTSTIATNAQLFIKSDGRETGCRFDIHLSLLLQIQCCLLNLTAVRPDAGLISTSIYYCYKCTTVY